eukprot:3770656-Rhodomonas_salina.1
MDLRATTCDIMAVQRFFSDKILGLDHQPMFTGINRMEGQADTGGGGLGDFAAWFGNDSRQIDAAEANATFHSNPAILQGGEQVEFAFKGRDDVVLLTTKRLVAIKKKGWTLLQGWWGKKE